MITKLIIGLICLACIVFLALAYNKYTVRLHDSLILKDYIDNDEEYYFLEKEYKILKISFFAWLFKSELKLIENTLSEYYSSYYKK